MINVVVAGVTGRMGSTLVRMLRDEEDMRLIGGVERPGEPSVGLDVGLAMRLDPLQVPVTEDFSDTLTANKPDVVIDFTSAQASLAHARICAEQNIPLVVGSTGFNSEEKKEMARWAKEVPMVIAPNMSMGIALVLRLASELARVLGAGFDVEILETHHRNKRDAPSGTALQLAEAIARVRGSELSDLRLARQGQIGDRPRTEIGIQSLRGGDVVGDHSIFFLGEGERIELTHRATSRDQFARGAIRAARWIVGKPAGLYGMQDVLELSKK